MIQFTKQMKGEYTILIPMMAPIHFELIRQVLNNYGYNVELLHSDNKQIVNEGLKYVHNDTCYPALLVIGQFIDALKSGKYDVNKTALMLTQTGGGCRASNYLSLLRKALQKAGFGFVPVISLNFSGLEKQPGFKVTLSMLRGLFCAVVYGDLLMLLNNQVKPYELTKGESARLVGMFTDELAVKLASGDGFSLRSLRDNLRSITKAFARVPVKHELKPKVGIVGEIYIKYAKLGNNNLEQFLESHGCEVAVPGMLDFVMYTLDARLEDIKLYGGSLIEKVFVGAFMNYFKKVQKVFIDAVKQAGCFKTPLNFAGIKGLVEGVIGHGNKMGEGWLLTAEMLELVKQGYENIVCTQPFGCLPNHICGKGMIRKIKSLNPAANIVPIDYDPGASRVNQENRLLLMLSVAKDKLAAMETAPEAVPAADAISNALQGLYMPNKEVAVE